VSDNLSLLIFSKSPTSTAAENTKKRSIKFKAQAPNKARQRGKQMLKTVSADFKMSLDTLKEVLL
jgi:hypothetical protein